MNGVVMKCNGCLMTAPHCGIPSPVPLVPTGSRSGKVTAVNSVVAESLIGRPGPPPVF